MKLFDGSVMGTTTEDDDGAIMIDGGLVVE